MQNNKVSKSQIFIELATMSDTDDRLTKIAAVIHGDAPTDRARSLKMFRMGEAAHETGIGRITLWRAIRDGNLKSVEIRKNSRRIPEDELRRFVEGR